MNERPILTFQSAVRSSASSEALYDVLGDPTTHLDWSGEQAPDAGFRLLTLDAPNGPAEVGSTFSSTGANGKSGAMVFHDVSTVTEAVRPTTFAFETDARLERKHRPAWHARFVHRYTVTAEGAGSRLDYTCEVYPQNYRPFWLHPLFRPATRRMVPRMIRKNLEVLVRTVEAATVTR